MSYEPSQCDDYTRSRILNAAQTAGACAAGFARIEPVTQDSADAYDRWIADGKNAGMDYLEKYSDIRSNPALLLDGTKSILCMAFPYRNTSSPRHPLFADYALGKDYHEVLRSHLQAVSDMMTKSVENSRTRICIDTAPLRERYWAVKAGIGFIGLNNQLIVPNIGSAVFLAEILWTAEAMPSGASPVSACQQCGRCIKACPMGALNGEGALDARRCLSYLTIEHRGEFPAGISLAGKRIYGCDICRDVCPHSQKDTNNVVLPEFSPSDELISLTLDRIATMTPADFRRIFRHSAIRRTKLTGLLRNAEAAKKEKY